MNDIALYGIDEDVLALLARALASRVREGGSIHLAGPLGAGKTTFARALLRALGAGERVKSPTYTLIETYALPGLTVQHLDLYRIAAAEELEWLGLRDLADGPVLWLIEWPERGIGAIPAPDLAVQLSYAKAGRDARVTAYGDRGARWLAGLSSTVAETAGQQVSQHS
ncbi:MAG: tRNA (adenosine(37)-N6)-threonylcarbamoyltransferase complex ATPase subunit type 1 TsaE [Xanthomonadaceae bacterium]|nr:tRNA (adenosine(37)-N6)-threonylcarbamoyltransferase complex ATPase subunit type 1 TsaE [Xanthomonadaceae bacterium]MDE1885360.1 tRNA (adenosine(37)-N6)-threonylcarbamoyltransferase complex ATPase subunit type 1 TsaE [Xanthomonadaceae bacterium]MDE1959986.1 tRNA (adenosine(37)-N6)-threonylcarbamoyltransferase complex ATPase subunit type 1 TsaE [Xanthomonadaceae bacterium]MDE2083882.1 tRNA (adenosine(37)-N6)-threonylcarbamoyltransferase complex ATPase subunit type 1 TsaE [Xanthomonadaceae bact